MQKLPIVHHLDGVGKVHGECDLMQRSLGKKEAQFEHAKLWPSVQDWLRFAGVECSLSFLRRFSVEAAQTWIVLLLNGRKLSYVSSPAHARSLCSSRLHHPFIERKCS